MWVCFLYFVVMSCDGLTCLEYSALLMETGLSSLLVDFLVITVMYNL